MVFDNCQSGIAIAAANVEEVAVMEKPQRAKRDFTKKCDESASEFYKAGMKYIAALDEPIRVGATLIKLGQILSTPQISCRPII